MWYSKVGGGWRTVDRACGAVREREGNCGGRRLHRISPLRLNECIRTSASASAHRVLWNRKSEAPHRLRTAERTTGLAWSAKNAEVAGGGGMLKPIAGAAVAHGSQGPGWELAGRPAVRKWHCPSRVRGIVRGEIKLRQAVGR